MPEARRAPANDSPATCPKPVQPKRAKSYFEDIASGEAPLPLRNSRLETAAAAGDLGSVEMLMARGAEVHTGEDRPLRLAAANGHLEVVRYLLSKEARVHARDDAALREAAARGYYELVELLLQNDADPTAKNCEALARALERKVQSPGVFDLRRATPKDGHEKTIKVLESRLKL